MSASIGRTAIVSAFLRSLLIQGSWNYRSMLGSGFAFAMLPGLKRLYGADPGTEGSSVRRHLDHFNAHPYLAGVALGAVLRLEEDGADDETVRRFKLAVRGPLGSLGDALVWATWLPGASVLALAAYWLGAPGWVAAVLFLVLYNVGHVALRVWGFRIGWEEGLEVGRRLESANLGGWTTKLRALAALLLGTLVGSLLAGERALGGASFSWSVLAISAFLAGLLLGHRAWRPAAATVVAAIGILTATGLLR